MDMPRDENGWQQGLRWMQGYQYLEPGTDCRSEAAKAKIGVGSLNMSKQTDEVYRRSSPLQV
jgi:hypothetical protein